MSQKKQKLIRQWTRKSMAERPENYKLALKGVKRAYASLDHVQKGIVSNSWRALLNE